LRKRIFASPELNLLRAELIRDDMVTKLMPFAAKKPYNFSGKFVADTVAITNRVDEPGNNKHDSAPLASSEPDPSPIPEPDPSLTPLTN
jgi:hypothetical protein